jgi:hypothetical protein
MLFARLIAPFISKWHLFENLSCYPPSDVISLLWSSSSLRIKLLYRKFEVPINKPTLKSSAKLAKKFMVLVKRKLQRDQVCRSVLFRKLLALAFASTRANAEDLVVIQNGFQ